MNDWLASAARRSRTWGLALACVAAASVALVDEAPSLTAMPTAGSLSTGEVQRYPVSLQPGDYLRIEVVQDGIEVALSLRDPTGSSLAEITNRSGEPLILSAIARAAGAHELQVFALEAQPRQGRYVVEIKERRPSVGADQARVKAAQALMEAERLWSDGEQVDTVDRALALYQQAFDQWGAALDPASQMIAARRLGRAHYAIGAPAAAIVPLRQSLELSQQVGNVDGECAALSVLGWAEVELGLSADAAIHTERALSMSRRTGDRRCEAEALNVMGDILTYTGRNTEAPALYEKARSISTELRDRRGEAQALLGLGYVLTEVSRIDEARAAFEAAGGLWRSVGERRGQARALIGLAQLHGIIGLKQRALSYYQQAQELVEALGDRWGQAVVESGLGRADYQLGQPAEAIPHYRSAVELFRRAKNTLGEAWNLLYLAGCLAASGRHDEAFVELQRALTNATANSNVRLEARVLEEIGHLHAIADRHDEALATYTKALSLAHTVGDVREETDALNGMGELLHRQGRYDDARTRLEEALRLSEVGKDPFAASNAFFGLARVEASRGRFEVALTKVQASLALVEELRIAVASLDLRASYLASIRERHELEIDLLTQLHGRDARRGYDARAFEASERARARSLLEGLAEARPRIHEGVDPALLQRETSLREQLNARAGRLIKMPKGERTGAQGVALEKEIDELTAAHKEVRARIRAENPRYAALIEPRPISLSEVQKTVVDERSVLLQYFLGQTRSYVWAVTPRAIASYVLPARAEIETLVRPYREELATPAHRRADRESASLRPGPDGARALAVSRVLLGPVAAHLDALRVVVVADGILESLPFAVLPDPRRSPDDTATIVPLVKEHEVVSLPSVSTLSLIRGAWQGGRRWPKEVLVLADPVFEADDPRLPHAGSHETPPPAARPSAPTTGRAVRPAKDTLRDADGSGPQSLPRLIGSRHEAVSIAALTSAADIALGFQASRATALEPGVKDHRIVHFATHAIVDNDRPELSGIVLSLFDESSEPRDGFVRLHDVYNMDLPVDLVVLSGCSSALGKAVAGEGLISLVRGFMYAGTRSVLASLWKVDDEATSELMTGFYRRIWKDGLTPSAALRAAQLDLMGQRRWQHPFYWAAFVLSGDWDSK